MYELNCKLVYLDGEIVFYQEQYELFKLAHNLPKNVAIRADVCICRNEEVEMALNWEEEEVLEEVEVEEEVEDLILQLSSDEDE